MYKYPFYVSECEETGLPNVGKPEVEAVLRDNSTDSFVSSQGLGYGLVHAECGQKSRRAGGV